MSTHHKLIAIRRNLAEATKLTDELIKESTADIHSLEMLLLIEIKYGIEDAVETIDEIEE